MNTTYKFAGLLLSLTMLSACGGGGGGSALNTGGGGGGGGSTTQNSARESLSFLIPIGPGHATGTPASSSRSTTAARKPEFVDANSDGAFTVIFDSTTIGPIAFAPDGQGTGTIIEGAAGPSGNGTLPNGGSYAFTSSYTYTNSQGSNAGNQAYADISLTFTTIPGSHTIGVVQTNGACDVSPNQCISNTSGYVLTEGQTTVSLQPGTNAAKVVVLKGVMESMYFCDAACDGQAGTYSATGYTITAFVADESGDAIPYQLDNSNAVIPFDNGSYQIVENDANGIVKITQPNATYSAPGTGDTSGIYGENITIACNKVGSTTVVAELLSTDPSMGSVAGYTYTANNYPVAGSILSSVGADTSFGNELSVSCSASGSITVQQKNRQS